MPYMGVPQDNQDNIYIYIYIYICCEVDLLVTTKTLSVTMDRQVLILSVLISICRSEDISIWGQLRRVVIVIVIVS